MPPLSVVLLPVPPATMYSVPPLITVVALADPYTSCSPLTTVPPFAVAPATTSSSPPPLTVVPLAVPYTVCRPPLTMLPLTAPPASTLRVPPLPTTSAFPYPPMSTTCDPVNTVAPLARP